MTRCIGLYSSKDMPSDNYIDDDDEDDDDDDLDDEDGDAYGCISDYEEDLIRDRSYNYHNFSLTGDENGVGVDSRRHRTMSEGNILMEPSDDNRRDHHNQLERKRRASIKTSYNDLREVIPSLRGSKASRAVILQRAVECIQDLVKVNRDHTHCVETLKRQNDLLDSRVQELQRLVQRTDSDDLCVNSIDCVSSTINNNNGSLPVHSAHGVSVARRVISGSPVSAISNVSIYRCLSQEANGLSSTSDESTVSVSAVAEDHSSSVNRNLKPCNLSESVQSLPVLLSQSCCSNRSGGIRYRTNSINTLGNESDYSDLVQTTRVSPNFAANAQSAFSPIVSSLEGSARSNSQRSSPSGISLSSNSSTTQRTNEDDLNVVQLHKVGTSGADHVLLSIVKPTISAQSSVKISTSTNSPPSIISNMTIYKNLNVVSENEDTIKYICNLDSEERDLPKRRKFK